jgi:hypothetical protein
MRNLLNLVNILKEFRIPKDDPFPEKLYGRSRLQVILQNGALKIQQRIFTINIAILRSKTSPSPRTSLITPAYCLGFHRKRSENCPSHIGCMPGTRGFIPMLLISAG